MAPAGVELHVLAEQLVVGQGVGMPVLGDQPEVETPVDDAALDHADGAHVQVQRGLRGLLAELGHRLGHVGFGVGGGFFEQRHVQVAAQPAVDVVQVAAEGVGGCQQPQCRVVHLLAFGGERKAAPAAPAQHQPQPGFQVFDVPADGGHGDVELQLGRGHAAAFHHALEHPQQPQIGIAQLPQHRHVFYLHDLSTKDGHLFIHGSMAPTHNAVQPRDFWRPFPWT